MPAARPVPTGSRALVTGSVRLVAAVYLCSAGCLVVLTVVVALALGARPVVVRASTSAGVVTGDVVLVTRPRAPLRRGTLVVSRGGGAAPAPAADVAGEGQLVVPLLGRPVVWLGTRALATLALWCLGTACAVAVVLRPGCAVPAGVERPAPREPRPPVPRARHAAHDVLPARTRPAVGSARA